MAPQDRDKMLYGHTEFRIEGETKVPMSTDFKCTVCSQFFNTFPELTRHVMQNPACDPTVAKIATKEEDTWNTAVTEVVGNPAYKQGEMEPIEYIFAQGMGVDFCAGNIIKYVTRIKHGGNRESDFEKAAHYLELMRVHLMGKVRPL